MTDIADFLVARIYEEEVSAHMTLGVTLYGDGSEYIWWVDDEPDDGPPDGYTKLYDPRAALLDCEARNAIVLSYVRAERRGESITALHTVLLWLALRYQDHKDYQPEWEPYRGMIPTFDSRAGR